MPDLLPLPGWDDKNDWRGYIPFDELPRIYNPPGGVIATANNRITHGGYSHYLSHFFEPPYRFRRISDLLAARQRHSVEDLAAMQLDEVSLHARELIGILKGDLTQLAQSVPALKSAADELLCWDGCSATASAAAAIFHVFHHRLLTNLLMPVLGEELFSAYVEILNQCIAPTQRILADPRSGWFATRSRADLVAASLREAVSAISADQGSDHESLVEAGRRLIADPRNVDAKVDFVTTYHMVIEGTLALTGQWTLTDYWEKTGRMPGFLEGFKNVARDEHRHVAYGTWYLKKACADRPELADRVRACLHELLPTASGVLVPPGQDPNDWELLGYTSEQVNKFAFTSLTRRLKVIGVPLTAPEPAAV
jgi:hypothetical protein